MIKALKNLFTNKHAIIWTVCYVFIVWAVLYFLFNFSIFNASQWHRLMNARLHGFAGFVFGILILSALPLYVATTTLIVRKNKPLITIPIPKITVPGFLKTAQPEKPKEEVKEEVVQDEKPSQPELPPELPRELHKVFLRARENAGFYQNMGAIKEKTDEELELVPIMDTLPLPSDFDVSFDDAPGFQDSPSFSVPTFTDVSFDSPSVPDFEEDIKEFNDDIMESNLVKHLVAKGISFEIKDDIVITPTHAIAVHEDDEFWATDETNWFASGKVRPSPIMAVKKCAQELGVLSAIYLGTDNILDIEDLVEQWQSDGIVVFQNLDEIQ